MALCTYQVNETLDWTERWSYEYRNGSIKYCNSYFDKQCNATITGDPDVAGYGVLVSSVTIAGITILFALMSASTSMVVLPDSILWYLQGRKYPLSRVDFNSDATSEWHYWLHTFFTAPLPMLRDFQLITGLGTAIAGFIPWASSPLYHMNIICGYWWMSTAALWSVAALAPQIVHKYRSPYEDAENSEPLTTGQSTGLGSGRSPIVWSRVSLRACHFFAGFLLSVFYYLRVLGDWDPFRGNMCFRFDRNFGTKYAWIWVAMAATVPLRLMVSGRIITLVLRISRIEYRFISTCWALARMPNHGSSPHQRTNDNYRPLLRTMTTVFGILVSSVCAIFCYIARQSITLLVETFETPEYVSMGWVFFYAANTSAIIRRKILNRDLVQNETNMGFGQISPLVLTAAMLYLALRDAAHQARTQTEDRRKKLEAAAGTATSLGSRPPAYAKPFFGLSRYAQAAEIEQEHELAVLPTT